MRFFDTLPEDVEKRLNTSMQGVIVATKCFIQGTMTKDQRDAVYAQHGITITKEVQALCEDAYESGIGTSAEEV